MPIDFASDDSVSVPDSASLDITGELSLSFWVSLDLVTTNRGILNKREATEQLGAWDITHAVDASTGLSFRLYSANGVSQIVKAPVGTRLTAGVWHHVVVIFIDASNETEIWVDGSSVEYDAVTITNNLAATTHPFGMGHNGQFGASHMDGRLSEVAIWEAVLSQEEIEALYNSRVKGLPLQIKLSDLKGYWPMDDGPDGTSADGDTIRDLSGNGNDGTGDDGGNDTGLTWEAEKVLSYVPDAYTVSGFADVPVSGFMTLNTGHWH